MTLTTEDVKTLTKPFAADEHEFLRGNAYIREWAICDRIEEVDPAWALERLALETRRSDGAKSKSIVIATFRMTIKGVARDGVGMADVSTTKDNSAEANEAEKAAATDALKRCARLFGVGRYLLRLPDNVRDEQSLARWLQGGSNTIDLEKAKRNMTGQGLPRRLPVDGTAALQEPPQTEKSPSDWQEATRVKYIEAGTSKYVIFNTPQQPRLYGRDKLRELGTDYQQFADKLEPGKDEPDTLPWPVLVKAEPKGNGTSTYWIVTDLKVSGLE